MAEELSGCARTDGRLTTGACQPMDCAWDASSRCVRANVPADHGAPKTVTCRLPLQLVAIAHIRKSVASRTMERRTCTTSEVEAQGRGRGAVGRIRSCIHAVEQRAVKEARDVGVVSAVARDGQHV